MQLIYFSKNSWWDARKARKVLLPLAFAELEGCSAILVNAATARWRQSRHPPVWRHPGTDMTVLSPVRWLPLQRFQLVRRINQWLRWRRVCLCIQWREPAVVVLSDYEDLFIARFARQAGMKCWFDWTEEWDAYARHAGPASQSKTDVCQIFHGIDGVIAVSRLLEENARAMGLETLYLPNAVSEAFIRSLREQHDVPGALKHISPPIAVHVGSYDPAWIDWPCLIRAAERNPGISFCMIGGGAEDQVPAHLPGNVYLLGHVAYEELPAILAHSVLCMLLYRPDRTAAGDPTKLYEYLASGRPIVSTPHPRVLEFRQWVRLADSPDAYATAVQEALLRDDVQVRGRCKISREHTWRCRAEMLRDRLF